MVSVLSFIGKFILEYIIAPIVLGYITTAAQFKPSINFPNKFPIKSKQKLLIEIIAFSLIYLILHIVISFVSGEVFLYTLF